MNDKKDPAVLWATTSRYLAMVAYVQLMSRLKVSAVNHQWHI